MTTKSYITFWGKIPDNVEFVCVFFSLSNKFSITFPQEVEMFKKKGRRKGQSMPVSG